MKCDNDFYADLKCNDLKLILLTEKDQMKCDNAFTLYSYIIEHDPMLAENTYYIIDESGYNEESNEKLKKNMIIRDSELHVELFKNMSIGIFSFGIQNLIPKQLTTIELSILYKKQKYVLISHGYTGGYNNTAAVSALNYGNIDDVVACTEHEYNHFQKLGYANVHLLGYPRMDKWAQNFNNKLSDELTIFFTFRRSLLSAKLEDLVKSPYVLHIMRILQAITQSYPKLQIKYLLHNALAPSHKEILSGILISINPNIQIIDNYDDKEFNNILAQSKLFITDYSSVGFDMSYDQRKNVIFYTNEEFLSGHYKLNSSFDEQTKLAHINVVHNENELIYALRENHKASLLPNKLYKYNDQNNSQRCANLIYSLFFKNIQL